MTEILLDRSSNPFRIPSYTLCRVRAWVVELCPSLDEALATVLSQPALYLPPAYSHVDLSGESIEILMSVCRWRGRGFLWRGPRLVVLTVRRREVREETSIVLPVPRSQGEERRLLAWLFAYQRCPQTRAEASQILGESGGGEPRGPAPAL